jgi:hypothetical protein
MSSIEKPATSLSSRNVAALRASLASLAAELLDMSNTFEPQDEQLFFVEPEIVRRARDFIAAAQRPWISLWQRQSLLSALLSFGP